MGGLRKKIEKVMMAVAFAEAGEHTTAQEFLREEKRQQKRIRPQPRRQLRA